jgi:hypothetical protein
MATATVRQSTHDEVAAAAFWFSTTSSVTWAVPNLDRSTNRLSVVLMTTASLLTFPPPPPLARLVSSSGVAVGVAVPLEATAPAGSEVEESYVAFA